jgi:hypothetical protein
MIADMNRPLIGIRVDNVLNTIDSGRYESNVSYSLAVAKAGGLPVLLPQEIDTISRHQTRFQDIHFFKVVRVHPIAKKMGVFFAISATANASGS